MKVPPSLMRSLIIPLFLLVAAALMPVASGAPARLTFGEATAGPEADLVRMIVEDLPTPEVATFGVALKHLPTGRAALLDADRPFESASLLKLPILYEAFRQREAGALSFDEELVITERHVEISYGESSVGPGDALSAPEALERMVTLSDNAPAIALLDRLGNHSVNLTLRELGLDQTAVDVESTTSARDMLSYFESLERLEAVSAEASREMLSMLLRQRVNDRLPALLPAGARVAHKTGDLPGIVHDAGLIYTPAGPVVVVLLSESYDADAEVREGMARLAADLYAFAGSGGFGPAVDPPLLWDPVLEERLREVLLDEAPEMGLAVKHLGTGQGVLIHAGGLWPAADSGALTRRYAGPSGPYAMAVDGRDLGPEFVARLVTTLDGYFRRCSWGAQEPGAGCGL